MRAQKLKTTLLGAAANADQTGQAVKPRWLASAKGSGGAEVFRRRPAQPGCKVRWHGVGSWEAPLQREVKAQPAQWGHGRRMGAQGAKRKPRSIRADSRAGHGGRENQADWDGWKFGEILLIDLEEKGGGPCAIPHQVRILRRLVVLPWICACGLWFFSVLPTGWAPFHEAAFRGSSRT